MCSVIRRLSRGLVRHPRHHLLNNEPALGPWPLRHDFIDCTMKSRSSSTGSLWLWQALSFMMPARHTSSLFISGFRLTTMRLSRRFRVGGLLFGGRMAAHPGRHCPGRGLLRPPRLHGAARRWAPFTVEGQFWESSQDTRLNLAVSWVCATSFFVHLFCPLFVSAGSSSGLCLRVQDGGMHERAGWAPAGAWACCALGLVASRRSIIDWQVTLSGNSPRSTRHKLAPVVRARFSVGLLLLMLLWSTLRIDRNWFRRSWAVDWLNTPLVGPMEDRAALGHAAVLVRGPAPVPWSVRRDATRTLPAAGSGARHEQRRAAGRVCCHPQT